VVLAAEQLAEVDGAIEAVASDSFAFLERLIAASSTVGNETDAQEIAASEFEAIGFAVQELGVPADVTAHPAAGIPQLSYEGRPNVLATTGPGTLDLLLNGHIDVVPADPIGWQADPFTPRTSDGWMIGRGAGDMKGGFAMAALALRALRNTVPSALERPLGLVSVVEEECTGNGTWSSIVEGIEPRAVVLPEPTDLGLLLAGVGVLWLDVELSGEGGHANVADVAVTPLEAVPVVMEALKDVSGEWTEQFVDDAIAVPHPYNMNVGKLEAGNWRSSVPTRVRLGIRAGFPRALRAGDAFEATSNRLTRLIRERAPGVDLSVRQSGFRAEGYALGESSPLVDLVAGCHETALGTVPPKFGLGSTTDARYYINQLGIPALCYGPVARNIHGVEERVLLSSIVDGARALARVIMRLDELTSADPAGAATEGRSR
jgi:acetylornithine deacetylase